MRRLLIFFFLCNPYLYTLSLADIFLVLLSEVMETISGRFGFGVSETFTLERESGDLRGLPWRTPLGHALDINITMFLPLACDEVNSLAPALSDPMARFRFTLKIADHWRVAQHETDQHAFFAFIVATRCGRC